MSIRWQVIDRQTGAVMGTYRSANRARSRRDKLDSAYGGCRYFTRRVEL